MEFITGVANKPHVTSMQHRAIYEMIIGKGSYILDKNELLEPELQSNNSLKIRSGMLAHHGGISEVKANTYDTVTIGNGSQGMKRVDLVVARYEKDPETSVETMEWKVIQGTPSEDTPVVPPHIVGNMQDGDLTDDCPAFQVHLDGIQVTEVKTLLPVLAGSLAELNSKLSIVRKSRKTYNATLELNSYIGAYLGHIIIPQNDLNERGEIISVSCRGNSSAPGSAYFYTEGKTYIYASCIDQKVNLYVEFLKLPAV